MDVKVFTRKGADKDARSLATEHGVPFHLFTYHRAPNGLITELFAQLDQMNEDLGYFEPRPWHRDRPQKPKVWAKDPSAANYWGIMPSEEMHK